MHIHLFTNESLYSSELLKLFNTAVNLQDHLFVFRKAKTGKFAYSSEVESRIIYSTNFRHLIWNVLPKMKAAKWIYFHYLPYGPSLILWAIQPALIAKSTWVIWGGDVFIYKQKKQSLKHRFYEFLRESIIPKFPEIAAFVEEDAREAIKVYHSKAGYVPILYPIPVNLDNLKDLNKREPGGTTNVLIGNSADPSNNHLEMLELLSRFNNEDILIYCPLSYYGDQEYISTVVKKGNDIFGDNFIPLLTMMTTQEYAVFLNDIDIAIMNHRRQQGLGNIMPLLFLGKKVFLRSDTSSFPFLSNAGCIIFDTCTMNKSNFASFKSLDKTASESNKKAIEKMISPSYYAGLWNNLFSKHQ
jgi:dTDP-N-acetylfucosamine:lipid II N-acetylfucosaminyltransferase